MKNMMMTMVLTLTLLMAGCATTPTMGRLGVEDRDVYYAQRGDRMHFMLVTQSKNQWQYGVSNSYFTGPHFTGTIYGTSYGEVTFDANRKQIRISENIYNLADGRILLVGNRGGQVWVEQLNLPVPQEAELIAKGDNRVIAFFNKN